MALNVASNIFKNGNIFSTSILENNWTLLASNCQLCLHPASDFSGSSVFDSINKKKNSKTTLNWKFTRQDADKKLSTHYVS